ncbi:hypothetical protein H4S01_001626 [Coemansia sp. RSA 2610]|nr:hypothetical protein H4S01_001626 [Coemansia sp. RSA 2610]
MVTAVASDIPHADYIAQLSRHLASVPATHIGICRRSAVALVIRLVLANQGQRYPEFVPPHDSTRAAEVQALDRFLNAKEFRKARAQLLFIQRAHHDQDPWSGNIGFPGGKHEAGDGSDQSTAERETREEVGLDLSAGFVHLGQLDDSPAYMLCRGIKIVVSPHVYLQTSADTPAFTLTDEVASAHWIDFGHILDRIDRPVQPFSARYQSIEVDIAARIFRAQAQTKPWWFRALGASLGTLHYTVLPLPYATEYSYHNQQMLGRRGACARFASDTELYLWGLSLGMVAGLVDLSLPLAPARLPIYRSVSSPWPQLGSWMWADINAVANAIHNSCWTPYLRKPWQRTTNDFLLTHFRVLSIL